MRLYRRPAGAVWQIDPPAISLVVRAEEHVALSLKWHLHFAQSVQQASLRDFEELAS